MIAVAAPAPPDCAESCDFYRFDSGCVSKRAIGSLAGDWQMHAPAKWASVDDVEA
jgi:hypothetical protein